MADVTIVDVDATWVNPTTVSYDAGELRRADAAMYVAAGVVRTSPTSLAVSVDGSDVVTVKAGGWVIPGNAVAGSGVWRGGIGSDVTAVLAARDATYGRIDLVVARQLDADVVGTHGAYTGRVQILTGTPSASPAVPVLPSMAVELGRVTVPASGGAAASVDSSHRTYATAAGGEIVAPSQSALPAGAADGQRAYALDAGVEYRWNGTAWVDQTPQTPQPYKHTGSLSVAVAFDSTGLGTITHGLGAIPDGISLTPAQFFGQDWTAMIDHADATKIYVKAAVAGVAVTSATRYVAWTAFRAL